MQNQLFLIDVGGLEQGAERTLDLSFPMPDGLIDRSDVVTGEVRLELSLMPDSCDEDKLIAFGTLSYGINAQCDRCLEPAASEVNTRFGETFSKTDDGESYLFSGETVDIAEMVTDIILTGFPAKILCGKECKGLCCVCGCNLNKASCGHTDGKPAKASPFDILKK